MLVGKRDALMFFCSIDLIFRDRISIYEIHARRVSNDQQTLSFDSALDQLKTSSLSVKHYVAASCPLCAMFESKLM